MSKPRTGAPKRVAVGLLAGAMALFGVALAPPAGAAANVTNERLAGATRYGTAAAIAGDEAFTTVTTALVATGENFPDALAAATLAGANAAAPIVLTQTATYTTEAKAGLAALKAKGVTAVTIVGGTSAVAQTVEDAIKADGFTVTRVAGEDRYETAAAIATAANTKSAAANISGLKPGLFASGLNFPDALAAGPAAYANKIPLLLVNDGVPAETANAISTIGIKKAYILGGTAVVSATVEAALVTATGNPATRLAGTNRFATATAIGDFEATTLAFPMTSAILATGAQASGGADALASGALGGQLKAPIVLTSSLPPESAAFLDKYSTTLQKLYVAGGTAAVDDATVAAAEAEAEKVGNDSANKAVTTRPELTGASVVKTVLANQVTSTQAAGTYVRYTFDEALGSGFGANFGSFRVYDATNQQYTGGGAGTGSAFETPATGTTGVTSVIVNFTGITSEAVAATLTKATVAFEAVRDVGGAGNPEGASPIGTAGNTSSTAGATTGPDLVSVGRFGVGSSGSTTAVDFTFDQAATVATTTGFHLVDVNNTIINCTTSTNASDVGGGTIAGGSGTTVITAACTNPINGVNITSGTIARGFVERGSVLSATGVTGSVQAADVSGNTTGPDLVSVAATPGSTNTAAVFTFDTNIVSASSNGFFLTKADGSTVATVAPGTVCSTSTVANDGGTNTCTVNSANPTQVRVLFTGVISDVVGGYVGSTTSITGAATGPAASGLGGVQNQVDEESATGATSTSRTPGKTTGPDLTGVALATFTDAFGNTSGYAATYTFDSSALITVQTINGFRLYMSTGQAFRATACTAGTGAAGSTALGTVRCDAFQDILTLAAPSPASSLGAAVLGTVQYDAARDSGGRQSPEEAAATTGGTGTAAS